MALDNLLSQNSNPDTSLPTAGQMPQQPMVPQQFPIGNPLLQAAQGLGGALQGNPNFQGGPPISPQDMLPSMPKNKLELLMMLAGPAMGMMARGGGKAANAIVSAKDQAKWLADHGSDELWGRIRDFAANNPTAKALLSKVYDRSTNIYESTQKLLSQLPPEIRAEIPGNLPQGPGPFSPVAVPKVVDSTASPAMKMLAEPRDIDWLMRYGEEEQPDVKKYLGH